MDWKLEVVMVPVSDVDRSIEFYQRVGFHLDHNIAPTPTMRVVQLTPPGSGCSIVFAGASGIGDMAPGSLKGTHLVVSDIEAARQHLLDNGIEASDVQWMGEQVAFVYFDDPDGNSWAVQEIRKS
ncbi:MAG: glyoxalase [Frankiales bacterium]|jgi:catechol 2,3-dioxygenase-like lactoylglutathione lyase family enzyme|nr:glyoxalase [Frankiales bacterium]